MEKDVSERLIRLSTAVRALERQLGDARTARDREVYSLWRGGTSARAIAKTCDMSPAHVTRIIDAQTADAQQRALDALTGPGPAVPPVAQAALG